LFGSSVKHLGLGEFRECPNHLSILVANNRARGTNQRYVDHTSALKNITRSGLESVMSFLAHMESDFGARFSVQSAGTEGVVATISHSEQAAQFFDEYLRHLSPSAAERNSSPAAAAGETLNSGSRNAAAVGCSGLFGGGVLRV
jgi:hypothetical protein